MPSPHPRAQDRRHAALSQLATVHTAPTSGAPEIGPRVIMPGGAIVPAASFGSGFGAGGGFSGGERTSASRGHIVFPTLDTSKEVNTTNRTEVLRKARWLYNNDPLCKRFADGFSRMLGWMMFKPVTPDREWNILAKRVALDLAMSPSRFDRAGKFNFFTYQLLLNRRYLLDGDMLSLATTGRDGGTQVLGVESHQIGSYPDRNGGAPLFWDGVRADRQGRPLQYSVLDPKETGKAKLYRAGSEAHLSVRYERGGQLRGMSAFHPVVNSMLDTREIENDITLGIKTRNLIGFYMAPRGDAPPPQLKGAKGLQAGLKQYRKEVTYGTDDVTGDDEELLSYEEVFRGGNVPNFDDREPKVLESAQPHENEMAFLNWRVRRAAMGFDLAPELLWDIGTLNGNTQRWVAADAQEVLEARRMETLIPFCQWWWFHAIGAEIASGRLREPKVPKGMENHLGWWSVEWIPPAKKTIDRGREGKLALDERRAMLRTLDEHFAEYQQDWSTEASQWLDEIIEIERMAREKKMPEWQIKQIIGNLVAPPAGSSAIDPEAAKDAEATGSDEGDDPVE
jgi:capsid protein